MEPEKPKIPRAPLKTSLLEFICTMMGFCYDGQIKGGSARGIGRRFRRYNWNALYHSDHIFHSHEGLRQDGLAVFPITLPVYYMLIGVLAMDGTVILT